MSWFYVDDGFADHVKLALLPPDKMLAAVGLWTLAGAWSRKKNQGGVIPLGQVKRLGGSEKLSQALVTAGLWKVVDGGFAFHDWSEWQETPEEVEKKKEHEKLRKQEWRRKKGLSRPCPSGTPTGLTRLSPPCPGPVLGDPSPSPSPSPILTTFGEERVGLLGLSRDAEHSTPANELTERRGQPRDQSGSQRQAFADLIRAEAFARDIKPAPALTDNQRRDAIERVLQYGEDARLGFEIAAKNLIAQAFDDAAETGDKFCFAILDATPGRAKPARFKSGNAPAERELSEPTKKALAEADKLRAAGKFF